MEKLTCVEYCQLVCGLKVILHALVSIRIGHKLELDSNGDRKRNSPSNSPDCLLYDSYFITSENLILGQLIIT